MKIYALIEEHKRKNTALIAEHGFCLYFEHAGKHILFDTGRSGSFIYNATLLGIDLSKVDACVISHAHKGHTGGLTPFLDINNHAKVYMKRTAADDCYTKYYSRYERSGIEPSFFKKIWDRIEFIDSDMKIANGVTASSVNKYRRYPLYSSLMYKKNNHEWVRDDLTQELFLAINTDDTVVVLTGCSHQGIINILMTAEKKFGHVTGVIGGFHLEGAKRLGIRIKKEPYVELRAIIKYLNNHKIKKVYTRHCTGEKPFEKLELLARAKKLYSGDVIEI